MLSKGFVNQVSTGLIAALSAFTIGMAYGWTSPNMESWLSGTGEITMDVDQSSWIASLMSIASGVPTLLMGLFVNIVGRKMLLLMSAPTVIVSWLIVIFTRSVEMLYIVRSLQGIAMGVVLLIMPIYQVEIAENHIRGFLGVMMISGYNLGILSEYILALYLSYKALAIVNIVIPVAFLLLFFTRPESPHYLLLRKQNAEALKSLAWLRGKDLHEVEEEFNGMLSSIENKEEESGYMDLFRTFPVRKAILIVGLVDVVHMFSGNSAILPLASYIFAAAGKSFLPSNDFAIVVAAVQACAIFFAGPTIDRLGRRFLLMGSLAICCLCQASVALFFYLKTFEDVSSYSWTTVVLISVYFFFNAIGTGSMIGVLTGELFPTNVRGIAAQLANILGFIASSLCAKIYEPIAESAGFYVNHLIFALFCAFGFVFFYLTLPETKGLSFDQIQDRLSRRNKKS